MKIPKIEKPIPNAATGQSICTDEPDFAILSTIQPRSGAVRATDKVLL